MGACVKCALSFVCLLLNYESIYGDIESPPSAVYRLQAVRSKRQAGYVYYRPSISFDLPTRNSIISTSTQASPVDRISMQMYYAYPAPAERTVNRETISTSATGSSNGEITGGTGYNYNTPNVQTESTGNIVNGKNSGISGYNYAVQNTEVQNTGNTGSSGSTGSIAIGDSRSSGYNYGVQNAVDNTQSVSVGNIETTDISGSNGYNYGSQNTAVQVTPGQNTQSVSTQTGYSYDIKNNVATDVVTNTGTDSGGSQILNQITNSGISTGGVSTNAPKYLPPSNVGISTGSAVNTQNSAVNTPISAVNTGSYSNVVAPSDMYLPPSETAPITPAITVVQTVSNEAIQTSKLPNPGYLAPNSLTNSQVVQTQTVIAPATQPQQVPAQNYLPPVVATAQGTISTPASSYLPPVF